jgi:hypothetical protein
MTKSTTFIFYFSSLKIEHESTKSSLSSEVAKSFGIPPTSNSLFVVVPESNGGDSKKIPESSRRSSASPSEKPQTRRISTTSKKGAINPFFGSTIAAQFYFDKLRVPDRKAPQNCIPIILETFLEFLSRDGGLMYFYLSY